MSKPSPGKNITILVSVGSADTKSISELEAQLKSLVRHPSRGGADGRLVTVVGANYTYQGRVYRVPDWEAWDGESPLPQALYQHDTPNWMYETNGKPPEEKAAPAPSQAPKSPAESLAGIKRVSRRRGTNAVRRVAVRDHAPKPDDKVWHEEDWGGWDE